MLIFSERATWVSETDLGSSPVSSFGIVSNRVVSLVSDPVWQRSVRLHHLSHLDFSIERLEGSHFTILYLYTLYNNKSSLKIKQKTFFLIYELI